MMFMIKTRYDFHVVHKVPLEWVQLETNQTPLLFRYHQQMHTDRRQTDLFSIVPNHAVPGFIQNASTAHSQEERIKESLYKGKGRVKHIFLEWLMPTLPQNAL